MFGIKHRTASIQHELRTMRGRKTSLLLGHGIRFDSNVVSIDIDESKVIPVEIRETRPLLSRPWLSTETEKLGRPARKENFVTKSYAITPESLPSVSKMDSWGRQDIESQAAKRPAEVTALYDLVLLRYLEIRPRSPCVSIQP